MICVNTDAWFRTTPCCLRSPWGHGEWHWRCYGVFQGLKACINGLDGAHEWLQGGNDAIVSILVGALPAGLLPYVSVLFSHISKHLPKSPSHLAGVLLGRVILFFQSRHSSIIIHLTKISNYTLCLKGGGASGLWIGSSSLTFVLFRCWMMYVLLSQSNFFTYVWALRLFNWESSRKSVSSLPESLACLFIFSSSIWFVFFIDTSPKLFSTNQRLCIRNGHSKVTDWFVNWNRPWILAHWLPFLWSKIWDKYRPGNAIVGTDQSQARTKSTLCFMIYFASNTTIIY